MRERRRATHWRGLTVLAPLFLLTACVQDGDVVQSHKAGEKRGFESPHAQAQIEVPKWVALRDQAEQGKVSWETVARSIAPELLESGQILGALSRAEVSTQGRHRLFHQAMLNLESSHRTLYLSLAQEYMNLLSPLCLESLESCRVAQLWDDDQMVAELFARISMDPDIDLAPDRRFRLALLASDLAQMPYPQAVRIAILESAEYIRDELLSRHSELPPAEQQLFVQWVDAQKRSLRYFRGREWARPILRRQLEVWNWSHLFYLKSHPVLNDRELIFEVAEDVGLLAEHFENFDAQTWREDGNIYQLVSQLQETHPHLIRNLELKTPKVLERDRTLFLLDLYFRERVNANEAEILLAGLDVTSTQLAAGIHTYIQTYFAHLIAETSEYMRVQLNEYEPSNIIFFREVIRRSLDLEVSWHQFVERSERFHSLMKAFAVPGLDEAGRAAVASVDAQVTGLRDNIRLMAVFPNMMMFTYFIAKAEFQHAFSFFGWNFTIRSHDILRSLMEGNLSPYFTFGTGDRRPISYIQVLYSFYFALKTETFETFGIPVREFLQLFADEYLRKDRTQFLDGFRNLQLEESKSQFAFESYLKACRALAEEECRSENSTRNVCKNQELFERPLEPNLPRVLITNPSDLMYRVGYGMPAYGWKDYLQAEDSTSPEFASALKIYRLPSLEVFPRKSLGEFVEMVRDDYSRRVRELHLFKELYLLHLRETGASDSFVAIEKAGVEELLQPYDKEIREFYTWVAKKESLIGDCNQVLSRYENRLIQNVFEMEKRHLEYVHDLMSEGQRAPDQLSAWNDQLLTDSQTHRTLASNKEYAEFALRNPSSAGPLQVNPTAIGFNSTHYTYSAIEFFARLKMYLEEGYPALGLEPVAGNIEFQWPHQLKSFPNFLAPMTQIPWTESRSEFVQMGLRHAFGHPRFAYVKWTSPFMQSDYALNRMQFLTALMKAGDVPVQPEALGDATKPCSGFLMEGDCWRLDADYVVNSFLEDYEIISIDSEWEQILVNSGMDAKAVSIGSLADIAYEIDLVGFQFFVRGFNGAFDHFYELTEKYFLSAGFLLGQTEAYNEIPRDFYGAITVHPDSIRNRLPGPVGAIQYFKNCRAMKALTFSGLSDIEHLLTPFFKEPALMDWDVRQSFTKEIEGRWQEDQTSGSVIEFYHSITEGPAQRPYLKSGYARNFYTLKQKFFEEQTGGFFLDPQGRCHPSTSDN